MTDCIRKLKRVKKLIERELGVKAEMRGDILYFEISFEGGYPPSREEEEDMERIDYEVEPILSRIERLGLKTWPLWDWCCGIWGLGVEISCE